MADDKNPLKDTVVVFFTSTEGHRYAAYLLTGTHVYVGGGVEAQTKAALAASGVPFADEPNPQPREKYGVESVDPRKLIREYTAPYDKTGKLPQ